MHLALLRRDNSGANVHILSMASIGELPLELFNIILDQFVTDNGVGATCVLQLVSRK
jgi:hypothetical protein